jgi:hypothetical protein
MSNHHKTFFAIDFDRCITRGEAFALLVMEVLDEMGIISYVELNEAKELVESSGGSFAMLTYLRDKGYLDSETEEKVAQEFRKRAAKDRLKYVAEDVDEFFAYLLSEQIPHAIISYGENSWQELKIEAAGLSDVPHQIVSHPRKSDELRSWMNAEGKYELPRIFGSQTADEVVLIDDKAVAFQSLPPHVRGYWMRNKDGSLLPSQQGTVPESVTTVYDFKSVIEREKQLI